MRFNRFPPCFFAAVLLFAASSLAAPAAFAQKDAAPPAAPPADSVPADVQKTLIDIGDLSLLRALLPVKLTPSQIDKILTPLQALQTEGAARRKTNETALRALSAEVAKARDAALKTGETVPADIEAKIVKAFAEADKRYAEAKKAAIDRVLPVVQNNLTAEQKTVIKNYVEEKMLQGKKFSAKAKPDAIENAALEIYIDRIFLDDRSIPVLTLLKKTPAPETPPAANPPAAKP